jgi:ribosomal protein L11 methyltransferase
MAVAQENAKTNHVDDRIEFAVQDLENWPVAPEEIYQVICANLIDDLLIAQKERIMSRLQPKGVLILSGILESQFEEVLKAFEQSGLQCIHSKVCDEWKSGCFKRNSTL